MLELHNDTWNESEVPITKEEFMNRMTCIWVWLWDEQKATIAYDDSDLFWGHNIVADLNQERKVIHTDIWG